MKIRKKITYAWMVFYAVVLCIVGYIIFEKQSEFSDAWHPVAQGAVSLNHVVVWCFGILLLLFLAGSVYIVVSEWMDREIYDLKKEKDFVEKSIKSKKQMLAKLNHEMSTPINGIMGMSTMLLRECKDSHLREYAQNIMESGKFLAAIFADIQNVSKMGVGKNEIIKEKYNLFKMLESCYVTTKQRALDKVLDFEINVDPTIPAVLIGDESHLRQVVDTMLSTVMQPLHRGKVIFDVGFERVTLNPSAVLEERKIKLIFSAKNGNSRFRSVGALDGNESWDGNETSRDESLKAPLELVHYMVELMGGTVFVDKELFSIKVEIPQTIEKDIPIGNFGTFGNVSDDEATAIRFRAPTAHILVVDDVPMNLRVVLGLLKETEIKIDTADNGMAALEKIKRTRYDGIFLDHLMPVMDGVETLSVMRTLSENPNESTPVIMLTANTVMGAKENYIKDGFSDYLEKPVREEALLSMLLKYLPANKVERELPDVVSEDESLKKIEPVFPVVTSLVYSKEDLVQNPKDDKIFKTQKTRIINVHSSCLKSLDDTGFVDVSIGLDFCKNDEDYYIQKLQKFSKESRMDNLNRFMQSGDYENYCVETRALKSASLMIGAVDLSSMAKSMEFACLDGHYEFITKNHDEMIFLYKNLLNVLKENLDGRAN